ncbi:MAG: hypothetical protein JW821_05500 [Deltaproteobacteria bacterium]|nr:hypothetical protein [Deltaproteobacteria bacterium]
MEKVLLEVVAPMLSIVEPAGFGSGLIFGSLGLKDRDREGCVHDYPEDWKEAVDYLGRWVGEIRKLYRHRVQIRVIDAQSPLGFWKQLRHRVFCFPAFIVDRKCTYVGWDMRELEALLDESLKAVN